MSASCAHHHTETPFEGVSDAYKRALLAVIAINGAMFVIEMAAGALAGSQALKADALDFFADTVTYAITLLVIGRSIQARGRAALAKGASLAIMAVWVLSSTAYRVVFTEYPEPEVMGAVGFLALAANLGSVALLVRHRSGDANVRSAWLCSRNDAIGNIAVIAAAAGVWLTASPWPDLAVAAIMATLFLWSSLAIIRQAMAEARHSPHPAHSRIQEPN